MINMATWENLTADVVDDLHLDPNNVRLELPVDVPEPDIMQDLFQNVKALDLVEGIATVGYLTHEVPIVVERAGSLIVVEGNRRVAALKAIQNPYLVPSFQTRINKAVARIPDRETLKIIDVKRAPSEDDAAQLIAALHTSNLRVRWTPARQTAFFEAQLVNGRTVQDLIARYPTVDVKDFVRRAAIIQLFKGVSYKDPVLRDALNNKVDDKPKKFPISTLARLYENDAFLELARITVDLSTGTAKIIGSKKRFAALAETIISDIVYGDVDTRSLNSRQSDSYKAYMNKLRGIADGSGVRRDPEPDEGTTRGHGADADADGGRTSSPTSGPSSASASAAQGSGDASGPDADSRRKKAKSAFLDIAGLSIPATFNPEIGVLLDELKRLSVELFPNASLDFLRTFIEKLVKAYADVVGVDIKSTGNSQQGHVQLRHCLTWMEEYLRDNSEASLAQVVKRVKDNIGVTYPSTSEYLNAVNHNHLILASPNDVRAAWAAVRPLIRWILRP
jgi:hypothetical protein